MRATLPSKVAILAAATSAAAASSNTTCATGLYIVVARGSGELSSYPSLPHLPKDTGGFGQVALNVSAEIAGSVIAGVDYPAADPSTNATTGPGVGIIPGLNITAYVDSENTGAKAVLDQINQYHKACPDSKIALIGYSQGANAVRDALCGGLGDEFSAIGADFNNDAPLSPDLVRSSVVAIALMGDPTFNANQTIDRGTGHKGGTLARKNITVCEQYYGFTRSWCDSNDPFCDQGDDIDVHNSYYPKYGSDIVQFIVDEYNNSTSGSGSGSTTTGTTSSSPTTSPTSSSTGKSSASGLALGQSLFLGVAVMVLVVLSVY